MLDPQWIRSFMFQLPGNNAFARSIPLNDVGEESSRRCQEGGIGGRQDSSVFRKGLPQMVRRHKELRITKRFHRAEAQNDPLPRALRGIDLPIELVSIICSAMRFNPIPVSTQTNQ